MRCAIVLLAVALSSSGLAAATTTVNVQVGPPALQFGFLYRDYGVDRSRAEREVTHLGEADFLVALHVARATGMDLSVVVAWRRGGMSWDAITRRCKRDGRIYYVELPPEATGPPYGRAHGHWRRHPHSDIRLTDEEIRELVLVRSVADHCKLPCGEVIRLRVRGESPKAIAEHRRRGPEDAAPLPPAAKPRDRDHVRGGPGRK
jgi:hypothetical protein